MNEIEKASFEHDTEMLMSHVEQFANKYGLEKHLSIFTIEGHTSMTGFKEKEISIFRTDPNSKLTW